MQSLPERVEWTQCQIENPLAMRHRAMKTTMLQTNAGDLAMRKMAVPNLIANRPSTVKRTAAGNEIDGGHAPQGIAERAGGGNDHGEGKGRGGQAADGDGHSGAIADSLLQLVELFLPGDFADAFLPKFASDAGKQDHSHS